LRPLEGASFAGFDLVVNATPLGMVGQFETETPVAAQQMRGARLAYDLVYNPVETRFLREARAAGCETIGGLAMLVAQAAEQFRLWTGALPPLGVMLEAAERLL
jgi:shikimate 5-dehydrogenase